jgi:hypothetical protein
MSVVQRSDSAAFAGLLTSDFVANSVPEETNIDPELYRIPVKTSLLSCVKAPGLSDRKIGSINAIRPILRSLNRGNFHAAQK